MARQIELSVAVLLLALTGWLSVTATTRAEMGDIARGARVYQRCYSCHTVDPNETARLQGPTLYRVVGRRAASVEDYSYSPALQAKAARGLVWTEHELDRFLLDPERAIPGNQMGFFGLPEARDRADLIAYLRDSAQQSAEP
jgi:cytochrome c